MNSACGREYSGVMERSIDVQISRLRRVWWEEDPGASALYSNRMGPSLPVPPTV